MNKYGKWFIVLIICLMQKVYAQSWEPVMPMNATVNINDLCFLNDGLHGWAVGSTSAGGEVYSVILRTVDGSNWSSIAFSDSNITGLSGVCFVDANVGWVVGSAGRIYKTTDGGNSWVAQASPTTRNLSKVHFIDSQHGWACGGWGDNTAYLVIRTTNGGTTWQNLSFGNTAYSCDDIYFVDSLNGWICGYDNTINGHIHRTTDGGLTWTRQTIPAGVGQVAAIDFPTVNKGWATTSSIYANPAGAILYTTDGGENWAIQGYTNLDYNNCLDCQDTMRIAISASQVLTPSSARVVVSTNGGNNWSSYSHLFNNYSMGIQYVGNNIWVTSNASQIIKSTNNGANWQWNYNAAGWKAIAWRDSSNGYLITGTDYGNDGYCLRSTDAGNNWFYDPNTPGGTKIQFKGLNYGWILKEGNSSGVYRTTNGGATWVYNSIGSSAWIGSIFFATQDSGWACGSNGTLRFTSNGGASWSSQSLGTSYYVSAVYFIDSQRGWACGGYGGGNGFIYYTSNGGATWNPQTPAQPDHFQVAYFVNQNLGILGSYNARVHRTTDGGTTWTVVQSLPHYTITDIIMKDTLNGWLLAHNYWGSSPGDDGRGFIYKTTDGGTSWIQSYVTPRIRSFLNDIAHHYGDVFWTCGYHSINLRYNPWTGISQQDLRRENRVQFQAVPNPFSRRTSTRFSLSHPASVEISIFNALGNRVNEIANKTMPSGTHEFIWNGRDWNGFSCANGLYFCVIRVDDYVETQKLILMK